MRELIGILAVTSATLSVFPRYDGVVLELISGTRLSPEVSACGYAFRAETGGSVSLDSTEDLPIWLDRLTADSTGFTAEFSTMVTQTDWALSGDSMVMLVFARAEEPIELPEIAWQGPPPPPDTSLLPDSLIYQAFESGYGSPWLVDFDCIVLDPGHGGRDPGAIGPTGSYEKDRTLEISLMVRDLLSVRMPEMRVVLTRTTDEYVSLGARTRIANRNRADLFVSIHCNAAVNREAHGFETFFLSRARSDDARAVEMLENDVLQMDDVSSMPSDPLSFLLADMAQSIFQNQSSLFAGTIQSGFRSSFPQRRDRGVKRAGFYVLRGAYMPAVLVEVGFISNPAEERELLSLDFRFRTAQAIVEAIMNYAERES